VQGERTEVKLDHIEITNWFEPGHEYWKSVQAKPSEPLIQATISMTLSWNEYHELIKRDEEKIKFVEKLPE